jgi:hypothetical protein
MDWNRGQRTLPYDGTSEVHSFLANMEDKIAIDQRIHVLDLDLPNTPARWWATHKFLITEWEYEKQDIRCRFQTRDQLKEEMSIDLQGVK